MDDRSAPLWKMVRAQGGGLLVAVPALFLLVLGAPSWLVVGYLIVFIAVGGLYVLRKRRASKELP